jgi:hypothetical protein
MPKGPQGQKRPADAIGLAVMVGRIATGEIEDTSADPTKTLWSMEDIAERIEANRPKPALGERGPRGPYKKRAPKAG